MRAWTGAGRSAPVLHVSAVAPVALLQPELQQWTKISGVLSGAGRSAALATELQRLAAQQLDSASYALDILKSELVATMPSLVPQLVPVAVVQLKPRPLRSTERKAQLAA